MIERVTGDRTLVDYEVMWAYSGRRAMSTIRAYCVAVACDVETRHLLFDADASLAALAMIKRRVPHRRKRAA